MSTAAAVHDPGLTSVEAAVRLATHSMTAKKLTI